MAKWKNEDATVLPAPADLPEYKRVDSYHAETAWVNAFGLLIGLIGLVFMSWQLLN